MNSFISISQLVKLFFLGLILIYFSYTVGFLWYVCCAGYFWFYRKNSSSYLDSLLANTVVSIAPVSGRVEEIIFDLSNSDLGYSGIKVRISMPWWRPFGLYLPVSCSIDNITQFKGRNFWRYSSQLKSIKNLSRTSVELKNKLGNFLFLEFIYCPLGGVPRLWSEVGDRGRSGAAFGFFPLGGTVLITLPESTQMRVKKGDLLVSGVTVLGGVLEDE